MERFLFLTDLHYGFERRNGHKVSLHDSKALSVALQFAADFKPHHVLLGGDMLDCASISHHNKNKPGVIEGFRLLADAKDLRQVLIEPLEALKAKTYVYQIANHERWIDDLVEEIPGIEGLVDIKTLLKLDGRWKIVPQGESHRLGKLVFIHGDQLSGGEHVAKAAVVAYEKSVRFGHFHTAQMYTKVSTVDANGHSGIAVPCLCKKAPRYGKGAPNRWAQGFLYGWIDGNTYNDYIAIIIDGKATINGKQYSA